MDQTAGHSAADQQIAEAVAAEYESLSPECRADAARLGRLLSPDFHEFGASGREYGSEGIAEMVAAGTASDDEPISVANMRGWLLADGLVMLHLRAPWLASQPHLAVAPDRGGGLADVPSPGHAHGPLTRAPGLR